MPGRASAAPFFFLLKMLPETHSPTHSLLEVHTAVPLLPFVTFFLLSSNRCLSLSPCPLKGSFRRIDKTRTDCRQIRYLTSSLSVECGVTVTVSAVRRIYHVLPPPKARTTLRRVRMVCLSLPLSTIGGAAAAVGKAVALSLRPVTYDVHMKSRQKYQDFE